MAEANERARAARLLVEVIYQHKTTDQSFGNQIVTPLVTELVYGSLRHYYSLSAELDKHLSRALRTKDLDLRCLMLVGAYQLRHLRIPSHAAVHETVNACRALRKPWAAKLVNAVLRALATEIPAHQSLPLEAPSGGAESQPLSDTLEENERSFELPGWLIERFRKAYGDRAPEIMRSLLERAPMSLRVNQARISSIDYSARLKQAGIAHHDGWMPENLILESPTPARQLPGLEQGEVSIQDAGALFTCRLLTDRLAIDSATGERLTGNRVPPSARAPTILDACAAPGGKLFHLTESLPGAFLWGIESSEQRLAHLQSEAERLGHSRVKLVAGDATGQSWWTGQPFDAILLDAPCSGTGTLRRHPDIKVLLRPDRLPEYARLQRDLLRNLWEMLKPGGVLLYCTCSLLEEENDTVIGAFIEETPSAAPAPFALPTGIPTRYGWQLLPSTGEAVRSGLSTDGFYYARLLRQHKAE